MYILSYERVVRAVHDLATHAFPKGPSISDPEECLVQVLNTFQPVLFQNTTGIVHTFYPSTEVRDVMVASGGVTEVEASLPGFVMNDRQRGIVDQNVNEAIKLLREGSGEAYKITELLLNIVVWCNAQGGGGSLVQNVGLVWFSPKQHWTTEFYAESLFHEALHQALFLEDMTYGVFGDLASVKDERMQVTSNFLRVKRRFDLAFHGVFVASELVKWYEERGNLRKARSFLPSTMHSIEEMDAALQIAKQEGLFVLTTHGFELYDQIKRDLAKLAS